MLAAFFSSMSCWATPAAKTRELSTPAGPLVIEQIDQGFGREFYVYLSGQTVLHNKEGDSTTAFPDFPVPDVIAYVGEPIGPFDAVAVFQQFNWGNACNGGPIWFLGINRNGGFTRSKPVDVCGGSVPPQVAVNRGVIHLTLPGTGRVPGEEWTYSGRELERAR
jgi:hypothetical protein